MGKIILIKKEVKPSQSNYHINRKKDGTQGSYYLNLSVEEELNEYGALEIVSEGELLRYKVSDKYKIILGEGIINIIGDKYNTYENRLNMLRSATDKFEIRRSENNSAIDHTEWFSELYNKNCQGAIFSVAIDPDKRKLFFDNDMPKFNTYFKDYEDIKHSNSDYVGNVYQEIYYGVPGTGKSKSVTDIIKKHYPEYEEKGHENVIRITVHPEYSYYDFIGNIMPTVTEEANCSDNTFEYKFRKGVFTDALKKAVDSKDTTNPIFLIIEEMSRGNIASIFGDIFQLLDRKDGKSEYGIYNQLIANEVYNDSSREIKIPRNLSIIGTVNTSDQNVYIMDNAFKRRFDFKYVSTSPVIGANEFEFEFTGKTISWEQFYQKYNEYVVEHMGLSEDKQIGQFYYNFNNTLSKDENYEKFCNKFLNYVWFDVHMNAYDGNSLISKSIKSFEVAIRKMLGKEIIFSKNFMELL